MAGMLFFNDAADLLQRIAQHIHEDDGAALRHRQAHEGAQAGGCDLPIVHALLGSTIMSGSSSERRPPGAPGAVGNPAPRCARCEKPALEMLIDSASGNASIAFIMRVLHTSSPSMVEPVMRAQ